MLKKKQRLNRSEFTRFFSLGKRFHSPAFQLVYHKNDSFYGAVVVGKKVFKKAVKRNLLRRRVYGVLYRNLKQKSRKGVFIVIAKPPASKLPRKQISEEINSLLKQVPGLE